MRPWNCLICLLGLFLAACHDTPRKNPFDPELTPAVELQVALDDRAGVATVNWTRYAGDQPFAEYRVLRNVTESTRVETLTVIDELSQTTFVDSALTPNTAYVYRISVVNGSGFESTSSAQEIPGYQVGPVNLLGWSVDARSGNVTLHWSRYRGARFEIYRIERRRVDQAEFSSLKSISVATDTSYRDADLEIDVAYFYRIAVEAGGTTWESNRSDPVHLSLSEVALRPVEEDRQEGAIRLSWMPYAGPDFQEYRVLRREVGTDQVESLGQLDSRTDTTFADLEARAGVDYIYTVVVQAAGQELESNRQEARLILPPVQIRDLDFNAVTATATLEWTSYTGPRFRAYRIVRSASGAAPEIVAEIAGPTVTTFTDIGLVGNTEYSYQVVGITSQDEETRSQARSGRFHPLVATWDLDVGADEYVRLYREEERLAALAAAPSGVRLLFFAPDGTILEEQVLLNGSGSNLFEPRSVTTALDPEGTRFLSLISLLGPSAVLLFDADGLPLLQQEETPFNDTFPEAFDIANARVKGEIAVSIRDAAVDNIVVSAEGSGVFADDFEEGRLDTAWAVSGRNVRPADIGRMFVVQNGRALFRSAVPENLISFQVNMQNQFWQDFRSEMDAVLLKSTHGLVNFSVGSIPFLEFSLRFSSEKATWSWIYHPPDESSSERRSIDESFLFFLGVPYRLGLEMAEGQFRGSIMSPVLWHEPSAESSRWSSLAYLENQIALTVGNRAFTIGQEGENTPSPVSYYNTMSEIRTWDSGTATRPWLGVCQPQGNQVFFAKVRLRNDAIQWPFLSSTTRLSVGVGSSAGEFIFPLSFDVGPSGRIYVLDAGNSRIQVFDEEGNYITQWGSRGSGPGEFDFGSGLEPKDFAGSVAVDDDGYIYVADIGNRRIQKFAP
jgi:hypothetical protein